MIYFAFYQSIFQYGLLVWGGAKENAFKPLQVNQNSVIRIILGKTSLNGSTKLNYNLLGVLPVKQLYKKNVLLFTIKKYIRNNTNVVDVSKSREHRAYNLSVLYTKKAFGQCFVDYLGPTYFNQLPTISKKKYSSWFIE
jgi:hypothetical protein